MLRIGLCTDGADGPEALAAEAPAGMISVRGVNPVGIAPRLQTSESGFAADSVVVRTVQVGETTTLTSSAGR